jgi:hypothetical protein
MVGVGLALAGTYVGNRRAAGWAGSQMHHDLLNVRVRVLADFKGGNLAPYFCGMLLQLFVSRDCQPVVQSRGMACAALRVATRLLRARRDSYG